MFQLRQFLASSFSQMQEPLAGLLDFLQGCLTVQKGKSHHAEPDHSHGVYALEDQ